MGCPFWPAPPAAGPDKSVTSRRYGTRCIHSSDRGNDRLVLPALATDTLTCARHGEATRLRCVSCDSAICPRCLVRTDVGLRCESCERPGRGPLTGTGRRVRVAAACGLALAIGGAVAALLLSGDGGGRAPSGGTGSTVAAGSWTAGAALPSIRGSAVAVVLNDGRALVAGGGTGAVAVAATELFDQANGTWRDVGSLGEARRGHQAVVLDDGRVLVAGGVSVGGPLASAEVYDPAQESWTATGPMATPRVGHSLTLLAGGRILVAGGTSLEGGDGSGQAVVALASTEVYDPAVGRWAPGPEMTVPRFEHTATRLDDGRVLITGGLGPAAGGGGAAPLAATELYDAAAATFVRAAPMDEARTNHAAAELADHRIVVVGGVGETLADKALRTAEIFDPIDGSWRRAAPLARARSAATATAMAGGGVLVAGGEVVDGGTRRSLADAELLDPAGTKWISAGRMTCPRSEQAAVRLADGRVLVVAGDGAFPGRPPVAQSCVDSYRPAAAAEKG